jgi:hypothetical protein
MLMFSEKDPDEKVTYGIDFNTILGSQTISGSTRSISVYQGTDSSVASMLIGNASAASGIVRQQIGFGVDGNIYRLAIQIATSGGDTLIGVAYIPVNTQ